MNLDGDIAVYEANQNNTERYLYFPVTGKKIKVKYEKEVYYTGFTWMNLSDNYVGVQYIKNNIGRIVRGDICLFDSNALVKDTIYKAQENELADGVFPSPKDNKLLFSSRISIYDASDPLGQLNPPVSIVVMDFLKKEVVAKIENIATSNNIDFVESPWFPDEERFIFTISSGRKLTIADDIEKPNTNLPPGIYLYDLRTDKYSILVSDGIHGMISPKEDKIAYIKDHGIWIHNLIDNKSTLLFTPKKNEQKITSMHWTPDGQYIYFTYYVDQSFGFFDSNEKLIRILDGQSIKFKKLGHGFGAYTWR